MKKDRLDWEYVISRYFSHNSRLLCEDGVKLIRFHCPEMNRRNIAESILANIIHTKLPIDGIMVFVDNWVFVLQTTCEIGIQIFVNGVEIGVYFIPVEQNILGLMLDMVTAKDERMGRYEIVNDEIVVLNTITGSFTYPKYIDKDHKKATTNEVSKTITTTKRKKISKQQMINDLNNAKNEKYFKQIRISDDFE